MEKKDIIEFFDRCAPSWDAEMIKSDVIIGKILDNAEVGAGMDVLDVACGTGVMFDYYLQRDVASVTGIDIAPQMAKSRQKNLPANRRCRCFAVMWRSIPLTASLTALWSITPSRISPSPSG